jgi:hypothetical protein
MSPRTPTNHAAQAVTRFLRPAPGGASRLAVIRGQASLLAGLLGLGVALLAGCTKPAPTGAEAAAPPPPKRGLTFLHEGLMNGLRITAARLRDDLTVVPESLAEKVAPALRPANPAEMRNLVIELTCVAAEPKTGSNAYNLDSSRIQLLPGAGADKRSWPCLGLSWNEEGDHWMIAGEGGPSMMLVYNSPTDVQIEHLTFLVPQDVTDFVLELRPAAGEPVALARIHFPAAKH